MRSTHRFEFGVALPGAAGARSWDAHHRSWGRRVRSLSWETPSALALVDPLEPEKPADRRRFRESLRASLRAGRRLHVLLTLHYHERSAPALRRLVPDAEVWVPAGTPLVRSATRTYRPGESRLPAGVESLPTARGNEALLWLPRAGVLAAGDVLLGGPPKPLRVCPASWLHEASRTAVARSILPALELPIWVLHLGHGRPIAENVRERLAAALREAGAGRPADRASAPRP